ncbi:MAG: hypothetical protein Q9227_006816 [Pyrenula ochraceoflavens]
MSLFFAPSLVTRSIEHVRLPFLFQTRTIRRQARRRTSAFDGPSRGRPQKTASQEALGTATYKRSYSSRSLNTSDGQLGDDGAAKTQHRDLKPSRDLPKKGAPQEVREGGWLSAADFFPGSDAPDKKQARRRKPAFDEPSRGRLQETASQEVPEAITHNRGLFFRSLDLADEQRGDDESAVVPPSYLQQRYQASRAGMKDPELEPGSRTAGTMTKAEKEAFTNLLQNLSPTSPKPTSSPERDDDKRLNKSEGRMLASQSRERMAVSEKIIPIYRSAVEEYNQEQGASGNKSLGWLQEALKGPTKRAEEYYRENHEKSMGYLRLVQMTSDKAPATLQDTVHDIGYRELEAIAKLVDDATQHPTGDYEIWKIFEEKIFPMIRFLDTNDITEVSSPGSKAKQKKREERKKKRAQHRKESSENTSPTTTPPALDETDSTATSRESDSSSSPELPFSVPNYIPRLTLVSRLYPTALNFALSTLVYHFPTSPIPANILPRIKSLGRPSYVLGANTLLFNTLLSHRWRVYSDLRGIDALLDEMRNLGVPYDDNTLKIIDEICARGLKEQSGWATESRAYAERVGVGEDRRLLSRRVRSASWWSMTDTKHYFDKMITRWGPRVNYQVEQRAMEVYRERQVMMEERNRGRRSMAETREIETDMTQETYPALESPKVESSDGQVLDADDFLGGSAEPVKTAAAAA